MNRRNSTGRKKRGSSASSRSITSAPTSSDTTSSVQPTLYTRSRSRPMPISLPTMTAAEAAMPKQTTVESLSILPMRA